MKITEKFAGTNACIVITEDDFYCQSRTRVITPDDDNFGFAQWAYDNSDTLEADLGVGRHYGEWWGQGIQRKYGLDHKRFSLFNTHRFPEGAEYFITPNLEVVPVLYEGPFDVDEINSVDRKLRSFGSVAAPGFDKPEGIVIYLHKSGTSYKITDAVQGQKHQEK